jgi:hypothetical protein
LTRTAAAAIPLGSMSSPMSCFALAMVKENGAGWS